MIRGLYTAAAGMLASQSQSDIIADNMANVRTPGFKEELSGLRTFPSMLIDRVGTAAPAVLGSLGTGVVVDPVTRLNLGGSLRSTGVRTDLALTGRGYFAVQTPQGVRYTRNGRFQLGTNGILQTADGYPVLGSNGVIGPLSRNFTVGDDGTVTDGGKTAGQIRVADIPAGALIREGDSLYASSRGTVPAVGIEVHQGYLETSNVDVAGQMVDMISVMKSYEANQKVIQTEDSTLDKAVNEVGKV
ncbi:flagellar basal-body rod protein FlgG [Peptococcaceae bacterium CEB3]|nr:flagellar basal-body rod protein FlgG [Peptococcaceae bacterium CEB3]